MVQLKVHYVLLALGAAAANSYRHQVSSLAVSHRSTLTTSVETQKPPITAPAQVTTSSDATIVNVDVAFHRRVVFTNSIAKRANATVPIGSTPGADAVRAFAGAREWSSILDTVVMALLGLTSIVVAVVLGRKQLRAMRVQLQTLLDTAHRYPRVDRVQMNDLESGQHDSDLDGDLIEVRSEITSADPQRPESIHDSAGFLPEPQPHVVGDDQLAQPVRDHEQLAIQPRGLADGDDSLRDGLEPREDEGQTPGATPTATSCSQFGRGRQDSRSLNLDNPKALHPDSRESHPLMIASISIR